MSAQIERFYRCREVCELLGISRATLYRKMDADEIERPLKTGSAMVRWPESAIARYQERIKAGQA